MPRECRVCLRVRRWVVSRRGGMPRPGSINHRPNLIEIENGYLDSLGGGGGGSSGTGGDNDPPPSTPQENADQLSQCVVDNLSTEDKAHVTPHSVEIVKRPRVGGTDVDGYAGCVRGERYITYVKERVAKRGGTSLRQVLAHEIAHHLSTDPDTCRSCDGRVHGTAFQTALGRVRSAAEGCN